MDVCSYPHVPQEAGQAVVRAQSICAGKIMAMASRETEEWLEQIGSDLERLFQETGYPAPKLARQRGWAPRVDVLETDRHVVVVAELAGVSAENITLSYRSDNHSLSIRGSRIESGELHAGALPHQLEIEFGEFAREVFLPPADLVMESATVRNRNGLLIVAIPKRNTLVIEHSIQVEAR